MGFIDDSMVINDGTLMCLEKSLDDLVGVGRFDIFVVDLLER